ncbi:MAG: hypothetical protein P8I11_02230 [Bacteroidia bacterium]|jgi:hypothetical protein|nr:hypothetical protein [Bacteroidia bacterium]|tara:strand:+ start:4957 stop:5640 length:684 start_codon:yes stop_codon:yes gene_type:complete
MNQRIIVITTLISLVLSSTLVYSQSKKEQILMLGHKMDSLNKVLTTERQLFETNRNKMEVAINYLTNQLDSIIYEFKVLNIKNENAIQSNIKKQDEIDVATDNINVLRDSIIALSTLLNPEKQLEDILPKDPWLGQKIIFKARINEVFVSDFSWVYFELFEVNKNSGPTLKIDYFSWKLEGYFNNQDNIEYLKEGDFYQLTLQRMEYDEFAPIQGADWMLVEMTKIK